MHTILICTTPIDPLHAVSTPAPTAATDPDAGVHAAGADDLGLLVAMGGLGPGGRTDSARDEQHGAPQLRLDHRASVCHGGRRRGSGGFVYRRGCHAV